jgi:phosphate transport system protein
MLKMGGFVEASIQAATTALIQRHLPGMQIVHEHEKEINKLHIEIDEACLNLLALQAPLAADLRLILSIIKINTDLERMGDQCVNIAFSSEHYLSKPPVKSDVHLPEMATQTRLMVSNALDAFVKGDITLARKVLEADDAVDRNKADVFKKMKTEMQQNPDLIGSCLDMILITRNLERLADHATNIAEDVIFVYTGQDIRHGFTRQVGST